MFDPTRVQTSIASKDTERPFNLQTAPTYYPTKAQFKDPLKYINSIRNEAVLYGICKIIPPKDFNPPFALNTNDFTFTTRFQHLNTMDASSRTLINYVERLEKFHKQRGFGFQIPIVDSRPLDLHALKKLVFKRGGHELVSSINN